MRRRGQHPFTEAELSAIHDHVVRSRAEQGLPPHLTDGPELRRIFARMEQAAALLPTAKRNRRKAA